MLLKTESYKKGILYSTFFNILNKGLVFVNSLIVAYFFGTQIKTDIYFYAYNTIVILAAFITSLNSSVLIPESMRIRVQHGDKASMEFLNFFIQLIIIFTLLVCLILIFNPVKAYRLVSDFDTKSLELNRKILLLGAPLIILMPIVNLLTDILTSYKYFTVPMLAGIINGLFSILFVLLFHNSLDILSLLAGLLLSYSLNFLLLIFLMLKNLSWQFRIKWIKVENRILKNICFAQAGNITSSLSNYLPLYLLSGFNAGIITSLNYAQQVSSMPTTLITNQFSSVAGIKFNELRAEGNDTQLSDLFLNISFFLMFILFPISGVVFLHSKEIFIILFKRGAFNSESVLNSARFLKYLILMLPLLAINTLVARLFMAAHLIKQSFWYQIILNLFLILFIYLGIKMIGIDGYFISLISIYVLNIVLQYFLLKRFIPGIRYELLLKNITENLLMNILLVIIIYQSEKLFFEQLNGAVKLIFGSFIYLFLLVFMNQLFKINNVFAGGVKKILNISRIKI